VQIPADRSKLRAFSVHSSAAYNPEKESFDLVGAA
jgi:hypothetical protein